MGPNISVTAQLQASQMPLISLTKQSMMLECQLTILSYKHNLMQSLTIKDPVTMMNPAEIKALSKAKSLQEEPLAMPILSKPPDFACIGLARMTRKAVVQ